MTRIRVLGDTPYDVVLGRGVLAELPALVGDGVAKVAVVSPAALASRVGAVVDVLAGAGFAAVPLEIPDGEPAKDPAVLVRLWSMLAQHGFTRSDAIVGFGGGATTDLAGFLAATWLRGVRVVHVPTTLLGMVDAAVGGKTGVNVPEGKNLVGSFHPPAGVLCDLETLETLPPAEYVNGLAEVIKAGFIADPVILERIEADPTGAATPGGAFAAELVERAVRVKAEVVSGDLRERTTRPGEVLGREMLNYGHTLGHAIEKVERYTWRHGEAVAVGMVYVAELACAVGRLTPEVVARHRAILRAVGLPVSYPGDRWPELLAAMRVDKKARADRLRFVVLDDVARPGLLEAPDEKLLLAAYESVSDPA